jgi:hypothetical protein
MEDSLCDSQVDTQWDPAGGRARVLFAAIPSGNLRFRATVSSIGPPVGDLLIGTRRVFYCVTNAPAVR